MRGHVLTAALLLLSMTFTVDERSWLHLGGSAAIANLTAAGLRATDLSPQARANVGALVCAGAGLYKEYGMDSRADGGDLLFDAIGCATVYFVESYGSDVVVLPWGVYGTW